MPAEMTPDEIKTEVIAQNLEGVSDCGLKITYIYKPNGNKRATSCVLEVACSPENSYEE